MMIGEPSTVSVIFECMLPVLLPCYDLLQIVYFI